MTRRLLFGLLACAISVATADAETITLATGQDPSLGTMYVAAEKGFFEKHGVDVDLQSGPSGAQMVSLLIGNQVQVVHGAEQAGLLNHNIDPNVVVAAQASQALRYFGVVARDIADLDTLKGKRIGVTIGSGSEQFWRALVLARGLNADDYTIVPADPPEMVAALERGNIDAAATWEPWVSRAMESVADTTTVATNEGVFLPQNLVYFNRLWSDANPEDAKSVMAAIIEASEWINANPDEAAVVIGDYLKMDHAFAKVLIEKAAYNVRLDQGTVDSLRKIEQQLVGTKRLPNPVDWSTLMYPQTLEAVAPDRVSQYAFPQ